MQDDWPLSTLSTFLKRNLRRQSHRRHEGSIKRAVALSQSLEVTEQAWRAMRAMGGVIQEEQEEQDTGGGSAATVEAQGEVGGEVEAEAENSIVDLGEEGYEKKTDVPRGPRQGVDHQVVEILTDKELRPAGVNLDVSHGQGRRGRY